MCESAAVPPATIESAVYSFEGLLPELESPPIAARRALDHAGLRLSVEAWRSLPLDERHRVTLAGVADRVDAELVASALRRASPPPQRISPASDPDPSGPPEALAKALEPTRAIDPKRWARLRAVDRYALAHTYRRAVARSAFSILGDAFDAVLAASAAPPPLAAVPQSPAPAVPYQPAGFYSSAPEAREVRDIREAREARELREATTARGGYDASRAAYTPAPPPVQEPHAPRADAARPAYDPPGRGFATFPPPAGTLSNHLNQAGEVHMVDVARKPKTERRAIAKGSVYMRPETLMRLTSREAPKGEVLATARVAAVMASKRTHEIIPLCHSVALTHLDVTIEIDAAASAVHVSATADAYDRTGCEMEAMVAVSTACLTIYDMLKGIDRDMVIADVKLMEKSGGRSGHYKRTDFQP
jgi:cyclic pyranopterin monophosphate synthase